MMLHPIWKQGVGGGLALLMAVCTPFPLSAQSPFSTTSPRLNWQPQAKWPQAPKDPGAPEGRRRGGAQRDSDCFTPRDLDTGSASPLVLEAVLPNLQPAVQGFTTAAHPTFWFYVDPADVPAVPMTFVLQNARNKEIYRTSVIVTSREAGVLHITLPPTAAPLTANQRYTWTLWLNCNYKNIKGNIYRAAADKVPVVPAHLPPLDQVSHYTDWGIWHDALTQLATLRRQAPDNVHYQQSWQHLLEQVQLQPIASAPLLSTEQVQQTDATTVQVLDDSQ